MKTIKEDTNTVRLSGVAAMLLAGLYGCGTPAVEPAMPQAHDHGEVSSALYGQVTFADDCTAVEEEVIKEAIHRGRMGSTTAAFGQCVREHMISRYTPCAGDPFSSASLERQIHKALLTTRTPNDLHIACTGGQGNASASVGSWGHTHTERYNFSDWLDAMVGSMEAEVCGQPSADPTWCRAPGDPWAQLAGTTWHEVSHTHGYGHDHCGVSRPGWDYQVNTVPYIVGNCLSEVLYASAATCGTDFACGNQGLLMIDEFNGDGCVCAQDPVISWDGTGSFDAAVASFDGSLDSAHLDRQGHYIVGLADVTGDDKADMVSVHTNGSAYVWTGREDGSFGGAQASFGGSLDMANQDGSGHYLVGVADVTGDGKADLVSTHENGHAYVWPGRIDGSFGNARSSFGGSLNVANIDDEGHYIIGLADVTGDGRADLISAHDNGNAYVWRGRFDGTFGAARDSFNGTLDIANADGDGHYIVGVSDVTGDGHADLVSTHDNGNAYVWPGRRDGTFGGATSSFDGTLDMANVDATGHLILDVKDVTGDGKADLVGANENGNAYVWPGRHDGSFGGAIISFNGTLDMANLDHTGHFLLGVGDVTGDGRADLVSAHGNGTAYVWPGR